MPTLRTTRIFAPAEFREERTEGDIMPLLIGHAAVFKERYETPWFSEEVMPGAFRATIERGDEVVALINHDPNQPMARNKAGNLELIEDSKGLLVRFRPTNTSYGRDLVENIRAKVIKQMSFGFEIEKEEIDKSQKKTHFRITQVKLYDVSPVTFPAYPQTDVQVAAAAAEAHLAFRLAQLGIDRNADPDIARYLAEFQFRQREIFLIANCS